MKTTERMAALANAKQHGAISADANNISAREPIAPETFLRNSG
jgi:hypothetical protein